MRRTAEPRRSRPVNVRETPAGAGNSGVRVDGHGSIPGDPRGCGEQPPPEVTKAAEAGRPPRVRGTARRGKAFTLKNRETPAGVPSRMWWKWLVA